MKKLHCTKKLLCALMLFSPLVLSSCGMDLGDEDTEEYQKMWEIYTIDMDGNTNTYSMEDVFNEDVFSDDLTWGIDLDYYSYLAVKLTDDYNNIDVGNFSFYISSDEATTVSYRVYKTQDIDFKMRDIDHDLQEIIDYNEDHSDEIEFSDYDEPVPEDALCSGSESVEKDDEDATVFIDQFGDHTTVNMTSDDYLVFQFVNNTYADLKLKTTVNVLTDREAKKLVEDRKAMKAKFKFTAFMIEHVD